MNADAVRYEPSTEPIDHEPRGYPFLRKENEALLRDTLAAAGVELGEWDDLILRWLANWEFGTVAVVASWVTRASSQSASAVDEPFLGASASPQARSPERDGTIGTPAVSPGARYASGNQTRRKQPRKLSTGRGRELSRGAGR
jgi:hypothetical protein